MTVGSTTSTAEAHGGGVRAFGELSILRSSLSGNVARSSSSSSDAVASGGAIRATDTFAVQASTISGNLAQSTVANAGASAHGGGIALDGAPGTSRVVNSTVTLNAARAVASASGGSAVAVAEGGGLSVSLSALRLTNATVARNIVSGLGAILFVRAGGGVVNTATLELRGTLAANTAPDGRDCGGPVTSLGYNLLGSSAGCTFTALGSDKQNRPARLGKLGSHGGTTRTITLAKGSPALNAIPKSACTVKADQRGVKRPKQKRCEIGAFERKPQ